MNIYSRNVKICILNNNKNTNKNQLKKASKNFLSIQLFVIAIFRVFFPVTSSEYAKWGKDWIFIKRIESVIDRTFSCRKINIKFTSLPPPLRPFHYISSASLFTLWWWSSSSNSNSSGKFDTLKIIHTIPVPGTLHIFHTKNFGFDKGKIIFKIQLKITYSLPLTVCICVCTYFDAVRVESSRCIVYVWYTMYILCVLACVCVYFFSLLLELAILIVGFGDWRQKCWWNSKR